MNLVPVSSIFDVRYGSNLELNKLTLDPKGFAFVSRTSRNNGVSARIQAPTHLPPLPAGTITVAGGGSVMESFLQTEPYYSGRDLYYLTPKIKLSTQELLYYCVCLRANKYRFNYGRQANRTLPAILIPDVNSIPLWAKKELATTEDPSGKLVEHNLTLNTSNWMPFKYKDLFEIDRGRGPRKKELNGTGKFPFVSASEFNNGVTDRTDHIAMHEAGVISVVRNGNSVANAFFQDEPFCSTEDVHIFTPKFELNKYIALFLCTLIKKERYRYSYGRKWGIARMKETIIKLPANDDSQPDFAFMENYIKSLPFSASI